MRLFFCVGVGPGGDKSVVPVYVTLDTRIRAHSLYREGTLYLFMSSCSAYCSIL